MLKFQQATLVCICEFSCDCQHNMEQLDAGPIAAISERLIRFMTRNRRVNMQHVHAIKPIASDPILSIVIYRR